MRPSVAAAIALLVALAVSAEKLTYSAPSVVLGSGNINSGGSFNEGCSLGEVRNDNGQCVKAQITRNLFLFSAPPPQQTPVGPPPLLPTPKIHYNFVFIRSPTVLGGIKPIVVPPPQQKTLVYVLSKRPSELEQEVIELGSTAVKPEVYFVNYGPGDNPDLPGGISLQEALSQSAHQGQIIDGGGHGRTDEGGGIDLRTGHDSFVGSVGGNNLNLEIVDSDVSFEVKDNLNLNDYSASSVSSGLTSNIETNSFIQDSLTNDFLSTAAVGVQGLGEILSSPPPVELNSGSTSNIETNSFIQDSLTNDFLSTAAVGVQGLGEILRSPPPVEIYPPSSIY